MDSTIVLLQLEVLSMLVVAGIIITLLGIALSFFFERKVHVFRHRFWLFLLGVLLVVGGAFKYADYNVAAGLIALALFVGGYAAHWMVHRIRTYPGCYPHLEEPRGF